MSGKQRIRLAVAGASGYAGGELLRLAARHPGIEIGAVTAHTQAGSLLGSVHPHLPALADRVFEPTTVEALAGHDVVALALPHGASGGIAAALPDDVTVLDIAADHRLASADDWVKYYGSPHAGTWDYGMPELLIGGGLTQRENLRAARRVAVPGCNVTAVTLGLQPGIAAGLIESRDLVAVLANGYSGAGRTLKANLLASEALGSAAPYAVGGVHRHIPEIAQNLRVAGADEVTISFTPTLVPMSRGILATATARLAPGVKASAVRAAWESAYEREAFVHLLPSGILPTTAMALGANTAFVQVAVDEEAGRVVTVTAIDNLVKGTAGTAIQCLNLTQELPESEGLITEGVAP